MKLSKMALSVLLALGCKPAGRCGRSCSRSTTPRKPRTRYLPPPVRRMQAGQEKLTQGRSLLLPSVNLNANTTYNDVTTSYPRR